MNQNNNPNDIIAVVALALAVLTLIIASLTPVLGPVVGVTAAAGLGGGATGYWVGRRRGGDA